MARHTKKYVTACHMLDLPTNANLPHEAVYGMLALRGFRWSGKKWEHKTKRVAKHRMATIRVSADSADAGEVALLVATALEGLGFVVTSINGPSHNRKDNNERYYINTRYEV